MAPRMVGLSRRAFLVASLATATAGRPRPLAQELPAPHVSTTGPAGRSARDPFTLGVASGEPAPDGMVLWTRLAPHPLAEDGRGGMPARDVEVDWELAADAYFRDVVRHGTTTARAEEAHSVHVELAGLRPGAEYFYRFRAQGHLSPAGRTRTAPQRASSPKALTLAAASCANYEHGYFTAYRRLAEDEPELVVFLGDYLYETRADSYPAPEGNVRDHAGPETATLANYRLRYAQYKTDPDLQAAHAVAPWIAILDDHEVDSDWADEVPGPPDRPGPAFLRRRAAAFRAYYENLPLRRSSRPHGIDMQLYRRIGWGRLATFHLLDTRQYRDDQVCGEGLPAPCAKRSDPERSITGDVQERWLLDGLAASRARWDLVGQQVLLAERDFAAGAQEAMSMDNWDGYTASRDRLLRGLQRGHVRNPVVLTGDVHRHYAAELRADFADPFSSTVGVELATTSITTGGDGSDREAATDVQLRENPHLRFANSQRGYIRARLTASELRADFRVLGYVQRRGAPVRTRASYAVEAGRPGLHSA